LSSCAFAAFCWSKVFSETELVRKLGKEKSECGLAEQNAVPSYVAHGYVMAGLAIK